MDRLLVAWQEAVFELYLAEEKVEPEVVENMQAWQHSGFSVEQSVLLLAGDQGGTARLIQYMIGCPFSLSRLVKVTESRRVVYKAEKKDYRAFSDQQGDGIASGPKQFALLSVGAAVCKLHEAAPRSHAPINNRINRQGLTQTDGMLFGVTRQCLPADNCIKQTLS